MNKKKIVVKWLCPHCGQYSEDEDTVLRCCGSPHKCENTQEEWEERGVF